MALALLAARAEQRPRAGRGRKPAAKPKAKASAAAPAKAQAKPKRADQEELIAWPRNRAQPPPPKERPLPTREEILAFIAEHPGKAGKREIARAFGITGGDRIGAQGTSSSDLADEGVVERRRGRLKRPGDLPPVSVLEITGRDADGELVAEPVGMAVRARASRREYPRRARSRQAEGPRRPASATASSPG